MKIIACKIYGWYVFHMWPTAGLHYCCMAQDFMNCDKIPAQYYVESENMRKMQTQL